MSVSVLVMTRVGSFGELIQQALQETGLYRVTLVRGAEQALEQVRIHDFPVAVLDFDVDSHPEDLVDDLYALSPSLRVIAMKDEAGDAPSSMENLRIAQHLDSPFYLPDLLDALEVVTADLVQSARSGSEKDLDRSFPASLLQEEKIAVGTRSPEWLNDVSLAAIHLTQLSLQSTAHAALITRDAQLWAYAGHLPHPAAEELAQFVGQYWYRDGGSDFARFIRLDAVSEDYILYATGLGGDYVLALAFDVEIPFTKIRSQAKALAVQLMHPSPDDITIEQGFDTETVYDEDITAPVVTDEILEEIEQEIVPFPSDWRPDPEIADSRQSFFEDLLSSVEIPEPDGKPIDSADDPPDNADKTVLNQEDVAADSPVLERRDVDFGATPRTMSPADTTRVEEPSRIEIQSEDKSVLEDISSEETLSTAKPSSRDQAELEDNAQEGSVPTYLLETLATPLPDYLRDTLPTPIQRQGRRSQEHQELARHPQSDKSAYSQLTYACVLVPKRSGHHLVGDLAIFINRCVVQVGKAFGWQLEHLAVRPNYLHWVIAIPPGISPGYMVRIMRDHASHRIFSQFPNLARENRTGDFWASGYLIVNGKYPLSDELVEDFIKKIRVRQVQPQSYSLTDL
jgi:REP element-mobilizing transposase RayT